MSIAGMIAREGAEVRVLRPTTGRNADGSSTATWEERPRQKVRVVDGASTQAQRLWGATSEAKVLGMATLEADILMKDALLVEDGDFAGERFRIIERRRETRRQVHLMLGLQPTTETFLVDGLTI